eukprot:CAMPEP_0179437762 /NCGR_PEP_ID=MMETSP0799-20121207/21600_1 /TAXON_ID=46947 /ORGANISM="Geminigera cryophila, Strain CCMP2564" /LENGTH=244 /DNA_ID=CAMNT_0021218913 /DNA_START=1 /DNA_END=735 /DNA_ORIENTATION=+
MASVKLKVSEEVSEGVLLWNASLVLKTYLEDKRRCEFAGATVLELGAGAGHLSLALSRMGARVTTSEAKCNEQAKGTTPCKCWGCILQLRHSLGRQLGGEGAAAVAVDEWVPVEEGAVRAIELEWGESNAQKWSIREELATLQNRPDILIMSEVIYNQSGDSLYDDEFHDNLVWTLMQLVKPGTIVYNVFVDRPFSFMFFAKIDELPGKPFQVQEIKEEEYDNLGLDDDDAKVFLHRLVYSPSE